MSGLNFEKTKIVKGRGLSVKIPLVERMRAARGVPQAVVKVISYGHGAKSVSGTIDYISREGELELETESGDLVQGREERKELVRNWSRDFGQRKESRDSVHIAFSMPRGSDPEALRRAARAVLTEYFAGHEFVFAVHQDRPHPHAHAVVKMRSRKTGKKLRLNRPELHKLREVFAEAAREQGVMLAASPRAARGVGTKSIRQVIYKLHQKGIVPRVEKETAREMLFKMEHGGLKEKPWERAIQERNEKEREAYHEEGERLRAAAVNQEPRLRAAMLKAAADLERYSRMMPKPKTRRQLMLEKARKAGAKIPEPPRKNYKAPESDLER